MPQPSKISRLAEISSDKDRFLLAVFTRDVKNDESLRLGKHLADARHLLQQEMEVGSTPRVSLIATLVDVEQLVALW